MLAASLNAFFCASPIYGSAEDFTFLLDITVSREVTPAAKQQIGETRKKCNSDDRRQWRKQGGVVGAAASRMRAAAKQTLGAATRLSEAASIFGLRQPLWGLKGASSPFLVGPARRNRWCFSGSLLARKRELNPNAKAILPRAQARDASQKKKSQCSTWNTGPLPSPLCRCRRDAHGILNVPIPLFPVRRCRYTVVRHQADGVVDGIHKNADVLHH